MRRKSKFVCGYRQVVPHGPERGNVAQATSRLRVHVRVLMLCLRIMRCRKSAVVMNRPECRHWWNATHLMFNVLELVMFMWQVGFVVKWFVVVGHGLERVGMLWCCFDWCVVSIVRMHFL